jgi:predicted anti-sigma-YlaC factor YlaD
VARAGLAWPALASGQAAMSAPVHMAHETGAWSLGVAAAFLAVAAAPRLAAGALPFLGTFTALLVPVTLADLGAGHVHADRAAVHLLLLAGLVLVATVAWRGRRRRARVLSRQRVPA